MIDQKFVRKHLDLSTSHVTAQDMLLLRHEDSGDVSVPRTHYEYGVIVFVMAHGDPGDEQDRLLEEFKRAGYSQAFCDLYNLAWEMDVDMIRLDQDAEESDDLPTFDW